MQSSGVREARVFERGAGAGSETSMVSGGTGAEKGSVRLFCPLDEVAEPLSSANCSNLDLRLLIEGIGADSI